MEADPPAAICFPSSARRTTEDAWRINCVSQATTHEREDTHASKSEDAAPMQTLTA
jgi:hypothetical protein